MLFVGGGGAERGGRARSQLALRDEMRRFGDVLRLGQGGRHLKYEGSTHFAVFGDARGDAWERVVGSGAATGGGSGGAVGADQDGEKMDESSPPPEAVDERPRKRVRFALAEGDEDHTKATADRFLDGLGRELGNGELEFVLLRSRVAGINLDQDD